MPDTILDRAEALAAQLESSSDRAQGCVVAQQPGTNSRFPQTASGGVCNKDAEAFWKGLKTRLQAADGATDALSALQEEARKLAAL